MAGVSSRQAPPAWSSEAWAASLPEVCAALLHLLRVHVGVSSRVAAVLSRLGVMAEVFQLTQDRRMLVDAQDDEVAGVGTGHAMTYGCQLLQHDLHLTTARRALRHTGANSLRHELGGDPGCTSAQTVVLADDDDVEMVGRNGPELANVVVAAVAGGTDHADA